MALGFEGDHFASQDTWIFQTLPRVPFSSDPGEQKDKVNEKTFKAVIQSSMTMRRRLSGQMHAGDDFPATIAEDAQADDGSRLPTELRNTQLPTSRQLFSTDGVTTGGRRDTMGQRSMLTTMDDEPVAEAPQEEDVEVRFAHRRPPPLATEDAESVPLA